jgi:malonate-semialdehyde dehydrogenase (acetylating)/methylmalonate-semialdehyde dehydrogenase
MSRVIPRVKYLLEGKLLESAGATTFPITCPATGAVIGATPQCTASELDACAASSERAFAGWSRVPPQQRARVNFKLVQMIRDRTEEVAALITREQGKTLADARGDVFRGLEVAEYACGAPSAALGAVAPVVGPHMETVSHRLPIGVCAGIFAFNFPAMLPLWGFPLAAGLGNTYLLKPSERVPGAGVALAAMAQEAGLPPGVLNVVHGGPDTVNFLCDAPPVAAVSFVGSNAGGEHVFHRASKSGKRVQSNMGAKNHGVLLPDADMGAAVGALVGAAFGAAGQRCMALPVVVCVGSAAAAIPKLVAAAARLRVGRGDDPAADVGPLISAEAAARARRIVGDAVAGGARVLLDGRAPTPPPGCEKGFWMGPTILHLGSGAAALNSPAYKEEIFAPVMCVMEADTMEEAMGIVNANPWGNGGAVFTTSGASAHAFVHGVNIGQVGVNVPIPVPLPVFSFTGNKRSFLGSANFFGAPRGRALFAPPPPPPLLRYLTLIPKQHTSHNAPQVPAL